MSKPKGGARQDPHSLAPIQLERRSDAQELAGLRRGNGVSVALTLVLGVLATAGGARLLKMMDTRQVYATAAAQLERSDTDHRDAFLRCALPTYQRSQLTLPNALRVEVARATERWGRDYARVLASCEPQLASFQRSVRSVKAPADMKPRIEAVALAADDFGRSWIDLREWLRRSGAVYDANLAAPFLAKIDASWQSYRAARDQAKRALSTRL